MRDTPENRATQEILLNTGRRVLWFRNLVEKAHPLYAPARTVLYGIGGKGGSDWLGIVRTGPCRGMWIAREDKRVAGGRLTAEQRAFQERVREAGGIAIVARCSDDVHAAIDEAERRCSADARAESRERGNAGLPPRPES